eukprot:gb/GEZN01018879.1/.p1 GENE.gb/GEZN01018879.1/~~gb/GEZN01018879.1/.p1  ORF type:complete len:173 (-),score=45.63 gb/GEZN01018879.1/:221-739(-)
MSTWNNFFVLLAVAEEFVFYTRECNEQETEAWFEMLKECNKSPPQDEKVETIALWLEADNQTCKDEKLVTAILATMDALHLNRKVQDETIAMEAAEINVLKKAQVDYEFWSQVALNIKGLSQISVKSQESRVMLLDSLSRLLSDRNNKQKDRVYSWRRGKSVLLMAPPETDS